MGAAAAVAERAVGNRGVVLVVGEVDVVDVVEEGPADPAVVNRGDRLVSVEFIILLYEGEGWGGEEERKKERS